MTVSTEEMKKKLLVLEILTRNELLEHLEMKRTPLRNSKWHTSVSYFCYPSEFANNNRNYLVDDLSTKLLFVQWRLYCFAKFNTAKKHKLLMIHHLQADPD